MSYSSESEILHSLLIEKDCHACTQIQQLLDSSDTKVIVPTLQLTRALVTLLPQFRSKMQREGLFHCLTQMSELPEKSAISAPASLATTPMDRLSHHLPTGSKSEQRRTASASYRFHRKKARCIHKKVWQILCQKVCFIKLHFWSSVLISAVEFKSEKKSSLFFLGKK